MNEETKAIDNIQVSPNDVKITFGDNYIIFHKKPLTSVLIGSKIKKNLLITINDVERELNKLTIDNNSLKIIF